MARPLSPVVLIMGWTFGAFSAPGRMARPHPCLRSRASVTPLPPTTARRKWGAIRRAPAILARLPLVAMRTGARPPCVGRPMSAAQVTRVARRRKGQPITRMAAQEVRPLPVSVTAVGLPRSAQMVCLLTNPRVGRAAIYAYAQKLRRSTIGPAPPRITRRVALSYTRPLGLVSKGGLGAKACLDARRQP